MHSRKFWRSCAHWPFDGPSSNARAERVSLFKVGQELPPRFFSGAAAYGATLNASVINVENGSAAIQEGPNATWPPEERASRPGQSCAFFLRPSTRREGQLALNSKGSNNQKASTLKKQDTSHITRDGLFWLLSTLSENKNPARWDRHKDAPGASARHPRSQKL